MKRPRTVVDWCPIHGHQRHFELSYDYGTVMACPGCYCDEWETIVEAEANEGARELEQRATFAMNVGEKAR